MALEYRFDHRGNVELQPPARRRSFCWLFFFLFVLTQVLAATWLYFSGYLTPIDSENSIQALSLRGKMDEQDRLLKTQAEAIMRLESRVATAQRAEQIQLTSNEALREQLILAETELAKNRERLLLYEEILAPETLKGGLDIQHFGLKPLFIDETGKKLAHDRYYQYHLVLTNVRGSETEVRGRFGLRLQGKQDDRSATLSLEDIAVSLGTEKKSPGTQQFALKYYQSLEGNIELPEGFVPNQVVVELLPETGKNKAKVTKKYDWDAFKLSENSTTQQE